MVCDLAETYHIYDMRALSPVLVARLVVGLRQDSRTKMAISGIKHTTVELMLAQCVDALNLIWWSKTVDGQSNKGRPDSLLRKLTGQERKKEGPTVFNSAEEYERARNEIINRR